MNKTIENCENLQTYHFHETNQYILICCKPIIYYEDETHSNIEFELFILDDNFNEVETTQTNDIKIALPECRSVNSFSLVYSITYGKYVLIYDCEQWNSSERDIKYHLFNFQVSYTNYYSNFLSSLNDSQGFQCPLTYSSIYDTTYLSSSSLLSKSFSSLINNHLDSHLINNKTSISSYSNLISQELKSTISSPSIKSSTSTFLSPYTSTSLYYKTTPTSFIIHNSVSLESSSLYIDNIINVIKINKSKEELNEILPEIINKIIIGNNYEIAGNDFYLYIRPLNSTDCRSSISINFTNCEQILREELNINPSRILTFLQMEITDKNEQSLINQVEYLVYDDNKKLLDLSLCNNANVQIIYSLKDNSTINISYISSFKDLNIDIFNINDSFFNYICQSYSESNNDVVLEDRIKDIYQNYSLCEQGCAYKEFIIENMSVLCDCNIKTNISTNRTSLNIIKFNDINIDSNFGLIKCYNLVFSFKGKLNNVGFFIFLILFFANITIIISIFYKGIKPIKDYLIDEMTKYGYISNFKNNMNIDKNDKISFPPPKYHIIHLKLLYNPIFF